MRKFPKFLKAQPRFYGLDFADLGIIMAVLYLALILNLRPLMSLSLCALFIATSKVIKKNFDLKGWLLPRKKEIFLTDIERGEP